MKRARLSSARPMPPYCRLPHFSEFRQLGFRTIEFEDVISPGEAHLSGSPRVLQDADKSLGQSVGIAGWDHQPSHTVYDGVSCAANISGDDRNSACARLRKNSGIPLECGTQCEYVSGSNVSWDLLEVHASGENRILIQAEFTVKCPEFRSFVPIADQHKADSIIH